MRFFLPENDDLVDEGYDLLNDQYGEVRKDVYVHEIYGHRLVTVCSLLNQ